MIKIAVYTCAIGNYDWIHRPKVKPLGFDFLRFSDRKPVFSRGWSHRELTKNCHTLTPRSIARFTKVQPAVVVPDYDIAIWIDSSVEILGDVTPLVTTFANAGHDIAMFPHPSGRTVAEEIDLAIAYGRIQPAFYERAALQRKRYEEEGCINQKVVESTILFYRVRSAALRKACDSWWHELSTYTERDQVSQPFAMRNQSLKIHLWDWHFDQPNPFFRRVPHRPKTFLKRLKIGAHFLHDSRLEYRIAHYAIQGAGIVRRLGQSLDSRF